MIVEKIRILDANQGASLDINLVADLVRATGPVSYSYQFGFERRLLDILIAEAWHVPQTIFSSSNSIIAEDKHNILGLLIGFSGPNFLTFKRNFSVLVEELVARDEISQAEAIGLAERARKASYLNPNIPKSAYYLHVLSVVPQHHRAGVGAALVGHVSVQARQNKFRTLQLDILSDNPAVSFYQALGFQILVETKSPELSRDHGFPSELRMALTL